MTIFPGVSNESKPAFCKTTTMAFGALFVITSFFLIWMIVLPWHKERGGELIQFWSWYGISICAEMLIGLGFWILFLFFSKRSLLSKDIGVSDRMLIVIAYAGYFWYVQMFFASTLVWLFLVEA